MRHDSSASTSPAVTAASAHAHAAATAAAAPPAPAKTRWSYLTKCGRTRRAAATREMTDDNTSRYHLADDSWHQMIQEM
jgi:hypothetical protein